MYSSFVIPMIFLSLGEGRMIFDVLVNETIKQMYWNETFYVENPCEYIAHCDDIC